MIPVKGHKHLFRDEKSGAIINYDGNGYAQYKRMKSLRLSEKSEIQSLRAKLDEIKSLLAELINKS